MKFKYLTFVLFTLFFCTSLVNKSFAQKSKKSTKKTVKAPTNTNIVTTPAPVDTTQVNAAPSTDAATSLASKSDSIPLPKIKKSLRKDFAYEESDNSEKVPLSYQSIRADDAVFRHKLVREVDCREKINLPFMYAADGDNGNQRFISILLKALQDSVVTAFSDDRFTTPMTTAEVAKMVAGEEVEIKKYDELGNVTGVEKKRNDLNLDSFYRYHIKEEVIFDKQTSRLYWRIIGIAPVKNIILSTGVDLGPSELLWVYFPDLRVTLSNYEVYNSKNMSAKMSWDDLFENRMFSGRIIKTSMDNSKDALIKNYPGLTENTLQQLFEGEYAKEKIFNYEQDLWSY
jgi:gliding motility associated protien GldN